MIAQIHLFQTHEEGGASVASFISGPAKLHRAGRLAKDHPALTLPQCGKDTGRLIDGLFARGQSGLVGYQGLGDFLCRKGASARPPQHVHGRS
jgi:hypothetical protein